VHDINLDTSYINGPYDTNCVLRSHEHRPKMDRLHRKDKDPQVIFHSRDREIRGRLCTVQASRVLDHLTQLTVSHPYQLAFLLLLKTAVPRGATKK